MAAAAASRWPVVARFLSAATIHPPGCQPECRACVPAAGELRLANLADRGGQAVPEFGRPGAGQPKVSTWRALAISFRAEPAGVVC